MGQILHKCAKTTYVTRKQIISSQAPVRALAKKFNINVNTVTKWKKRGNVHDKPMGNGRANSVLKAEEEQVIIEARTKSWLPLDDLFEHLKPAIPALTRSNLHRCLKFHGISRVPEEMKIKKDSKPFKLYEIGFLHIDITEFYLQKKKWYLFVAIDRTSKLCFAHLFDRKTNASSTTFLDMVIQFFPYKIHRILTDNGQQFTYRSLNKQLQPKGKRHPFTLLCLKNNIKHKLTAFYSPQTNGQVERMNHTIKEATLKFFHYNNIEQFTHSLANFLNYYNCSKKLKALNRLTPYQFIINQWKDKPKIFHKNPYHHCVGLNRYIFCITMHRARAYLP